MKANEKNSPRQKSKALAKKLGFSLQNSYLLYAGPSMLDPDSDVVAVISGFTRKSRNHKTKDLLQVSYFRADMHPQDAINSGLDKAVCGDCPFTKNAGNGHRMCFVRMQHVFGQYHAFCRGKYQPLPSWDLLNGWNVRLGSYGDPASVPVEISHNIKLRAAKTKGYTHSWKEFPELKPICMASVETDKNFYAARLAGWKTFRVRSHDDQRLFPREVLCLNYSRDLSCEDCPLCEGKSQKSLHVAVPVHGLQRKVQLFHQRFAQI